MEQAIVLFLKSVRNGEFQEKKKKTSKKKAKKSRAEMAYRAGQHERISYRCEICNVKCSSAFDLNCHFNGKRHKVNESNKRTDLENSSKTTKQHNSVTNEIKTPSISVSIEEKETPSVSACIMAKDQAAPPDNELELLLNRVREVAQKDGGAWLSKILDGAKASPGGPAACDTTVDVEEELKDDSPFLDSLPKVSPRQSMWDSSHSGTSAAKRKHSPCRGTGSKRMVSTETEAMVDSFQGDKSVQAAGSLCASMGDTKYALSSENFEFISVSPKEHSPVENQCSDLKNISMTLTNINNVAQYAAEVNQSSDSVRMVSGIASKVIPSPDVKPLVQVPRNAGSLKCQVSIYIIGDSFVCDAEKHAVKQPYGKNLGFYPEVGKIYWQGNKTLSANRLLDECLKIRRVDGPSVVLIHVGSLDLGKTSTVNIISCLKKDLPECCSLFPDPVLAWSEIIPAQKWPHSNCQKSMERCRRKLNSSVSKHVTAVGGLVIRHRDLEGDNSGLLKTDGIHLNEYGLDLLNLGFQTIIEKAITSLMETLK